MGASAALKEPPITACGMSSHSHSSDKGGPSLPPNKEGFVENTEVSIKDPRNKGCAFLIWTLDLVFARATKFLPSDREISMSR